LHFQERPVLPLEAERLALESELDDAHRIVEQRNRLLRRWAEGRDFEGGMPSPDPEVGATVAETVEEERHALARAPSLCNCQGCRQAADARGATSCWEVSLLFSALLTGQPYP
jgi:hypothetical protein